MGKLLQDIVAAQQQANNAAEKKYSEWVLESVRQVSDLLLNQGLHRRLPLAPPVPLLPERWSEVLPVRLHRDCSVCDEVGQTTWSRELTDFRSSVGIHVFECTNCRKNQVSFLLAVVSEVEVNVPSLPPAPDRVCFSRFAIEKAGQFPAWEAPLSRTLSRALGKEGRSLFVKGASSLRAGRGIGAVAYFRRIVENHIDDILRMVTESAQSVGDASALEAIKKATSNLYASERLKIAAQHTPPHLKPGGHSPLDVMYGAFSEGLHALSDDESAEVATRLLESITYFFEMWQENKDRAERFAQTIAKTATKSA
jgi:hypothetical protein